MKDVEREMEGTPGLPSLESIRDADSPRLIAIPRWESPEAAAEAGPRLVAIGGRDETCPRP